MMISVFILFHEQGGFYPHGDDAPSPSISKGQARRPGRMTKAQSWRAPRLTARLLEATMGR